jgi:hypothetical protein
MLDLHQILNFPGFLAYFEGIQLMSNMIYDLFNRKLLKSYFNLWEYLIKPVILPVIIKTNDGTVNVQDTSVFLCILIFSFKVSPRNLIFLKHQTPTLVF